MIKSFLTRGAFMNRSQRGLFHGKEKMYGNKVSFSNRKTRRSWTPHIVSKAFRSELLDFKIKIHVTIKAFRCIEKAGGLDNYLLFTKDDKLDSKAGRELRGYVKKAWEKLHSRKFDRRQQLYERRLAILVAAGNLPQSYLDKEIAKSDPAKRAAHRRKLRSEQYAASKLNQSDHLAGVVQEAVVGENAAKDAKVNTAL